MKRRFKNPRESLTSARLFYWREKFRWRGVHTPEGSTSKREQERGKSRRAKKKENSKGETELPRRKEITRSFSLWTQTQQKREARRQVDSLSPRRFLSALIFIKEISFWFSLASSSISVSCSSLSSFVSSLSSFFSLASHMPASRLSFFSLFFSSSAQWVN